MYWKVGEWYNGGMDEDNKPEQEYIKEDGSRPHVSVFGMDMDKGAGVSGSSTVDSTGTGTNNGTTSGTTKDDWRQHKEDWKAQRHAQREEWRARRHEWHDDHHGGGGLFAGLILLFVGVVALLYTLGFVSSIFWHAILPFWPILLILWGASIILGRHWTARLVLFVVTLAFLAAVIIYGLVRVNSPLVNNLPPNLTNSINNIQPMQQY